MEIVPIMKDSVVCLSKKICQQLGGISPLAIVYRVTNSIKLIDPSTAQCKLMMLCYFINIIFKLINVFLVAEVNSASYWRDSFQSVFKSKQLTEYTVMDIEPIMEKDRVQFPGQGQISYKVSLFVHTLFKWNINNTFLNLNFKIKTFYKLPILKLHYYYYFLSNL